MRVAQRVGANIRRDSTIVRIGPDRRPVHAKSHVKTWQQSFLLAEMATIWANE